MLETPLPDDPAEFDHVTPDFPAVERLSSYEPEPDDLLIPIRPIEVRSILETTDHLGLHREAIVIPLAREGRGTLKRVGGGRIEITAPALGDWNAWLSALPEALQTLGLTGIRRNEPDED